MRFAFLLTLAACASGGEKMTKAEVGQPAPDFELAASDGRTYKLSDFRGKKNVLLVFYCVNNTPG